MTMPTLALSVEEILAEHVRDARRSYIWTYCKCGEVFRGGGVAISSGMHRRHVAECIVSKIEDPEHEEE